MASVIIRGHLKTQRPTEEATLWPRRQLQQAEEHQKPQKLEETEKDSWSLGGVWPRQQLNVRLLVSKRD